MKKKRTHTNKVGKTVNDNETGNNKNKKKK